MISKILLRILLCLAAVSNVRTFAANGSTEKTTQLIAILRSPAAGLQDKAHACQRAGEFGTVEIVPALAALLDDERLAAYARSGLENIPDPAAAAALRSALGMLNGDRLAGAVNSLGVLRDEKAVGALQQLATDPSKGVVGAALLALGRIATDESIATVRAALRTGSEQFRADAASACLLAAERQSMIDKIEVAASIYDEVRAVNLPKALRAAAARGAIISRKDSALPLLLEELRSADTALRDGALCAARELPGQQITAALIAELARSKPSLQENLIGVLLDRRDPEVLRPIELLVGGSPFVEVRLTAIKALATIGASSSVPLLLESVAKENETEAAAALRSLSQIRADGADTMILKTLQLQIPAVRTKLITVLGDRRNVEAMLTAFAAATKPADKQTLIQILGLIGTKPACAAVQGALQDDDEGVREAAFRALVVWPDASAMPWLLANLKSSSPHGQRTLLWRGAIVTWRSTIRHPTIEYTAATAVEWFQQLNATVSTPAEKLQIVAGLSELAAAHVAGMELLRPYLDDPEVAAETASTVVQTARRVAQGRSKVPQPALLAALLEQVATGDGDKALRDEAATLAQQIRGSCVAAGRTTPEFRPLFNGRNFDGWEGDTAKSFRIVDGAIVGGNLKDKIPHNEFLATTRSYTNFILRAECKLVGPANGGIQIRSQRIPNHHEMRGYQADMSAGKNGGWWGCLYDESRRRRMLGLADRKQLLLHLKPDEWNQYEIRCEGRRIQLFINGERTVDYTEPDDAIPLSGLIAVQIHGGRASEAWYRSLSIAELP